MPLVTGQSLFVPGWYLFVFKVEAQLNNIYSTPVEVEPALGSPRTSTLASTSTSLLLICQPLTKYSTSYMFKFKVQPVAVLLLLLTHS